MERRREPRLKANQPVMVTALALIGMPPISGRVLDMSGSGLQLRLPTPVPCGSSVKVESPHMMMLGEVSRCQDDGNDFVVVLRVERTAPVAASPSRAIMEV
jgi:PilZ domain